MFFPPLLARACVLAALATLPGSAPAAIAKPAAAKPVPTQAKAPEPTREPTRDPAREANVADLAAILFTEARTTGRPAMVAIGHTVLNRMKAASTRSVRAVWDAYGHPPIPTAGLAPFDLRTRDAALQTARDLLDGTVPDPTAGAVHFFSPLAMPKDAESVRGLDSPARTNPPPDPDAAPPLGTAPCPVLPPMSLPLAWPALSRFVGQNRYLDARACTAEDCRAAARLACTLETTFRRTHVTRQMFTTPAAYDDYRRKLADHLVAPSPPALLRAECRMAARIAATVDGTPAHDGETRNALVTLAARMGTRHPACRTEILAAFPRTRRVQQALANDWGDCLQYPGRCPASFDPPLSRARR